ncbi:hypothetical protein N5F07_12715 [Pseudomonas chengduensis]|nr:hypothetical protein [Pseudomonas chengduensis]MDH1622029.1 hypothetical protein [Pseudomonas chengduensis]MDH1868820.1 hypothetical protein [Pseudomonas chengduensis]
MRKQMNPHATELANELEMKLDTVKVLAEITLDNTTLADCAEGAYLDRSHAAALMQAQVYLSQSIFNDFCKLMELVEVPHV